MEYNNVIHIREINEENEQVEEEDQRQISPNHNTGGLLLCLKIWLRILTKSMLISVPIILFLWFYFLPALVLSPDLVDEIRTLVYVKLRIAISWSLFFGFVSLYAVEIYGFYFSEKALFYCFLPGLLGCIFSRVFYGLELFGTILSVAAILSLIFMINRKPLPPNPPVHIIQQFNRKKETSKALVKMVLTLGAVYMTIEMLFPIYLNASLFGRLSMRLIGLPLMMSTCSGMQVYFLRTVPLRHNEYAFPMLWISNGYLKIFEKIFTNTMFESGDYLRFSLLAFIGAVVEMATHATYFYRISIVSHAIRFFSKLFSRDQKSVRNFSSVTTDDANQESARQGYEHSWMYEFRKKMIVEEISIQLIMTFTVTSILYLAHPVALKENFQMIPALFNCFAQIAIQLAFGLIGDVFGLYWTIEKQHIPLNQSSVALKDRWFWLWFVFSLWQSTQLIYWFLT